MANEMANGDHMTTDTTLTEFLRAQLDADEAEIFADYVGHLVEQRHVDHVLAQIAAVRAVVELHKNWPVLVERRPDFEPSPPGDDVNSMTFRMTQQIAWLTEQEYRNRFGDEPPTSPIIRALAQPYADRDGFREEWRA